MTSNLFRIGPSLVLLFSFAYAASPVSRAGSGTTPTPPTKVPRISHLSDAENLIVYDFADRTLKQVIPPTASRVDIARALCGEKVDGVEINALTPTITANDGARIEVLVANVNLTKFTAKVDTKQLAQAVELPSLFSKYLTEPPKDTGTAAARALTSTPASNFVEALDDFNSALNTYVSTVKPFISGVSQAGDKDVFCMALDAMRKLSKPNNEKEQFVALKAAFDLTTRKYYSELDLPTTTKPQAELMRRAYATAVADMKDADPLKTQFSDASDEYDGTLDFSLASKSFMSANPATIDFSGGREQVTVTLTPKKGDVVEQQFFVTEGLRLVSYDSSLGFIFPTVRDNTYGFSGSGATKTVMLKGSEQVTAVAQYFHGLYNWTDSFATGLSLGIGTRDTKDLFVALGATICIRFKGFGKTVPMYLTWGSTLMPVQRLDGLREGDVVPGDSIATKRVQKRTAFFSVGVKI